MTLFRSMRFVTLFWGLAALCLVIAGPVHATHPRPKGASPVRVPLVPAYSQCAAPNRTHGPPLAFPSCNPPAQTSGQATVGTPDAFGGAANFIGYIRINVLVGTPGPPDDSDVYVRMDLTDVRCVPTGARCGAANAAGPADYSGEVGFKYGIRFTDHFNAVAPGGGTDPATMQDAAITLEPSAITCAGTASTSTGSTCAVWTSYNAIHPGLIKDSKRLVEEIDDVHVYDGGADGDANTTADNTVFLRQGIFIP
jgi:hypothetical protein